MLWFLVVLITSRPDPDLSVSLASAKYRSHATCFRAAKERVKALALVGMHGRYTCMHHGEAQAEMAKHPTGTF